MLFGQAAFVQVTFAVVMLTETLLSRMWTSTNSESPTGVVNKPLLNTSEKKKKWRAVSFCFSPEESSILLRRVFFNLFVYIFLPFFLLLFTLLLRTCLKATELTVEKQSATPVQGADTCLPPFLPSIPVSESQFLWKRSLRLQLPSAMLQEHVRCHFRFQCVLSFWCTHARMNFIEFWSILHEPNKSILNFAPWLQNFELKNKYLRTSQPQNPWIQSAKRKVSGYWKIENKEKRKKTGWINKLTDMGVARGFRSGWLYEFPSMNKQISSHVQGWKHEYWFKLPHMSFLFLTLYEFVHWRWKLLLQLQ